MTFGNRLKTLRKQSKMTQKDLGNQLDVGEMTISGYESGSREPNFERLKKISIIFNVTTDYLLFGEESASIKNVYWENRAREFETEVERLSDVVAQIIGILN
ncbi:helix-turn-helix domain-containing protein [Paenibacillus macquariensis]|uniref:Transcriptional regulator, contains XRE-family HTH domain n=2 Tax=Paenibacillus macquariensis TaxID=948756 RepID=A0ABY1JKS3_9BACL|nr:helix-turn-helix transcriptional regulator [Paenibacillus macquariensis]OAB31190.1 hypothetical protein PMSM_20950 [Paenibacillus macquariensis subsp. macquariensis]SIQ34268.1 Transcriptional regulator, contains XRE-family HTH domain [Paenibacillus macquariensis]